MCKDCGRQFIDVYSPIGYPEEVKRHCLHLYLEGNGFRRIERLTGVCHNTVINWVKAAANNLPTHPDYPQIPEVSQVDELQTYGGKKKHKMWVWTAVNKGLPGILAFVVVDRSSEIFKPLWKIIRGWECFFM